MLTSCCKGLSMKVLKYKKVIDALLTYKTGL